MSTLTGTTATQKLLIGFWDTIDISDNMERTFRWVHRQRPGLSSFVMMIAMLLLAGLSLVLAYIFDFSSTWDGLQVLQAFIIPRLPESAVHMTVALGFILTIAPTVLEIGASGLAKEDIKIVQYVVIGFTLFDLITDIPRAMAFTNSLQANFDQLGMLSGIGKTIFFLGWLFMSTLGFELLLVIFTYAAILFFFRWGGWSKYTPVMGATNIPQGQRTQPQQQGPQQHNGQPKVQTVVSNGGTYQDINLPRSDGKQ